MFNKICVPSIDNIVIGMTETVQNITSSTKNLEFFQKFVQDVKLCWVYYIVCACFALVFSIILMFLLRFLGGVLIWIMILGFLGGLITIGVLCHIESNKLYG